MFIKNMVDFKPRTAEELKAEIITDLGVEYVGNEEVVDKMVTRELKAEEFKASLHADKVKHLEAKRKSDELLAKAGLDPETGAKKIESDSHNDSHSLSPQDVVALRDVHEEDLDYLMEEAKLRKKSILDVKKDPYTKIILQARQEERKTAAAANINNTRRTEKQASDFTTRAEKADETLSDDEMKQTAKSIIEGLKKNR